MPKAYAVLVKPKTDKGHAGAGLAVLVPLNANAAADPACDAAAFYKGGNGKPLMVRTMSPMAMQNELRRAERFAFEGNKHKDVQEGRVENARAEVERITKKLSESFTVQDKETASGAIKVSPWVNADARIAAESAHAAVSVMALKNYTESMDVNAEDLLRIAVATKHPLTAQLAVEGAIKEGATLEALMVGIDTIPHEKASLACYKAVKDLSAPKAQSPAPEN